MFGSFLIVADANQMIKNTQLQNPMSGLAIDLSSPQSFKTFTECDEFSKVS